jgi:putative tryptophan/tyrosine transport system substrate-binding protein
MDRAAALRLPTIYQWPELAEEGGFAAYGPRFDQIIRDLVARQLVQLFRGTKIADIPVEQPTKFELVINLKTAKGVTVPEALLVRADKVTRSLWREAALGVTSGVANSDALKLLMSSV